MGQVTTFTQQGLQPAYARYKGTRRGITLPYGGQTNVGGVYAQGTACALVGGTAQPEKWVVTVSGSPSGGTFALQFVADKPYSTGNLAYNATAAQVLAGLQKIFGTTYLPANSVSGSAGGPWTITFGINARIGGLVQFVNNLTGGSSPSVANSLNQRGSVGPGQYDIYDGSLINTLTVSALLVDEFGSDPTGARVTTSDLPTAFGQPFSPPAWVEGFFFAADIPNLVSGMVSTTVPGLNYSVGAATTDAGAIVRLIA